MKGLQLGKHLAHALKLPIALPKLARARLRDALDFGQTGGVLVQNKEGLLPKVVDDARRQRLADALDGAAFEIGQDAGLVGGRN